MNLLCDRPHARFVDFKTSRFVVAKTRGMQLGDRKLEMGDEVPPGALNAEALRQEYEPWMANIETVDYAREMADPTLREACARRGVSLERGSVAAQVAAAPASSVVDLDALTQQEMKELCKRYGQPTSGNRAVLRDRLATILP